MDDASAGARESTRLEALRALEILDTPPEPAFDRVSRLAATLLGTPLSAVTFIDAERQWIKSGYGSGGETLRSDAFCNTTIQSDDVFVVPDAAVDGRFADNPYVNGEKDAIRFYAGCPIRTRDGDRLGAVCVMDYRARARFDESARRVLRDLAAIVEAELEARRAAALLNVVSGLPNQLALVADLDRWTDEPGVGPPDLLIFECLDAERFDVLVQTIGIDQTQAFVVRAAEVLRGALAGASRVYHLEGSRFATLALGRDGLTSDELARRAIDALTAPIVAGDVPVRTDAAVGIARGEGNGRGADRLLRSAVAAVHHARATHQRSSHYDAGRDAEQRRAFRLLGDLANALAADDGQIALVYQPKVDLISGRCVGAEALLRWQHPDLGAIAPLDIVTLAERTGSIAPLTAWVLRTGLRQLRAWRDGGVDIRLALNVSMLDFDDRRFATLLADELRAAGVPPDSLELEVTESAVTRDMNSALATMDAVRALGVDLVIDDFGTGQSAHSYLRAIPASALKIDQSFVRSLFAGRRDKAIVTSMIDLARLVGCRVIAEGIEDATTCAWLRRRGCHEGQGYHFAPGLAPSAFIAWMRGREATAR